MKRLPRVVHIERKRPDLAAAVETLRAALLRQPPVEVSVADAAVLSGLPLGLCEPALCALWSRYPARLRVTEDGALRFRFGSLQQPRGTGPLGRAARDLLDRVRRLGQRLRDPALALFTVLSFPPLLLAVAGNLWALAAWLHRLPFWIEIPAAILLWPFLFLLFSIGFLSAVLFQIFPAIAAVLLGCAVMLWLIPWISPDLSLAAKPFVFALLFFPGFLLAKVAWMLGSMVRDLVRDLFDETQASQIRDLWRTVGGFLFGPASPTVDALSDERRLLALIRRQDGVITDGDLMALFGWTRWQAEDAAARVLADYGGDVVLTDDLGITYRFAALLESDHAKPLNDEDIAPIWKREQEPPRFFGCPRSLALWVLLAMGLSVLGLALYPETKLLPDRAHYALLTKGLGSHRAHPVLLMQTFGMYPYAPIALLLLLRLPLFGVRQLLHARRSRFHALLRLATEQPQGARLSRFRTADLVSVGGRIEDAAEDDAGARLVRFPEREREQKAARSLRQEPSTPSQPQPQRPAGGTKRRRRVRRR